jgi:GH24 family phage-related lysozyme (muramidase)
MIASNGLIELIKEFEGFSATAYKDGGGVWTVGYGTTHIGGISIGQYATCTEPEACQMILDEVNPISYKISKMVTVHLTQNQFDALVDFTYNLGIGAFGNSTLLKKLNAGDYEGAANEFLRWDHDNGKKVAGLTRRRIAERALFLRPDYT